MSPVVPSTRNRPDRARKRSLWLRLLLALAGGLVALLVLAVSTLLFGAVEGTEFSPDTFRRCHFFYFEIPVVRVQAWPITRNIRQQRLDEFVSRQPYMRLPRRGKPRWDLARRKRAGEDRVDFDAAILCTYLDAIDENGEYFWLSWSKTHPARAKLLWPVIGEIAERGLYVLAPQVFQAAKKADSKRALRKRLAESVASGYRWFAANQHDLGDDETAIEFYSAVLEHLPDDVGAFDARAESYMALGQKERAAQDRARASELRASADNLPRQ